MFYSCGPFNLPSDARDVSAPIGFGGVFDVHAKELVSDARSLTKIFASRSEIERVHSAHHKIDAGLTRWKSCGRAIRGIVECAPAEKIVLLLIDSRRAPTGFEDRVRDD